MDRFTITDFRPLTEESLGEAIAKLRAAAGESEPKDVLSELGKVRHGTDSVQ
jgi:hypothetical protein